MAVLTGWFQPSSKKDMDVTVRVPILVWPVHKTRADSTDGQEWRVTLKIKIMQLNAAEMILWFCVVSCNGRFNASHYVQYCPHLKDTVFLVQVSDVGQIWTIKFLYLFHFAGFKGKVDSSKISSKNWRNKNDQSSLSCWVTQWILYSEGCSVKQLNTIPSKADLSLRPYYTLLL